MAYKAKINGTEYDLKDRFTIKEELNETLDSATIQFNVYGEELNAVSFDYIEIYDSEDKIEKKNFLVDSYDDEVFSFGSNFTTDDHSYTLTTFSETKELERITLPNCTVTQSLLGTKTTVWEQIQRFCELYLPSVKVYDSSAANRYKYSKKYTLDTVTLQAKFGNIVCPEFQWNNPTLREVLNDLMSTADCIVVAKQGIISCYDLREGGNVIDRSLLSYSKRTMNSADFAGELTIDMQNAVGKNKTVCCEYISLKADGETGTLTTANGVILTQHPIYSIKKLICYAFDYDPNSTTHKSLHKIEVTDRVLEFEEWDLLSGAKIQWSTSQSGLPNYTDMNGFQTPKHKLAFLYYNRGGRQIYNMGIGYATKNPSATRYFAKDIIGGTCVHLGTLSNISYLGLSSGNIDPRTITFYVEYETVAEHSMHVGKYLAAKHPENRMFDNQENSYVDIQHQSIYEYAKVNRLGNKLREIYGEYASESSIPQLGDHIGEEILFSREITYLDDIFLFKGLLTPNYVLKDFYTGVRAKKRSWQIAKSNDALTRHDIYKLYIEASFSKKTDDLNYAQESSGIISASVPLNLFMGALITYTPYFSNVTVTHATSQVTTARTGTLPGVNDHIVLDTDIEVQGMSLCLNFGFNDNFKSAEYVLHDDDYVQSFYSYADSYGEFLTHKIGLIHALTESSLPTPLEEGGDRDTDYISNSEAEAYLEKCYLKPKITISQYGSDPRFANLVLNVKKDNREIIQHTLQFEFCSDTRDIVITQKFIEMCLLYNATARNISSLRFYESQEAYKPGDTEPKGDWYNNLKPKITFDGGSCKIEVYFYSNGDYTNQYVNRTISSWAFTDSSGNLLLAVNQQSTTGFWVYFNELRSRDINVYKNTYSQEKVGDLTDSGLAALLSYNPNRLAASSSVRFLRRNVDRSSTTDLGEIEEESEE